MWWENGREWKGIEYQLFQQISRVRKQRLAEEIKLQYCYPRLDVNVTKGLNHLLKSPFCVHPKTGRVCIPINVEAVDAFNPELVPTVRYVLCDAHDPSSGCAARIKRLCTCSVSKHPLSVSLPLSLSSISVLSLSFTFPLFFPCLTSCFSQLCAELNSSQAPEGDGAAVTPARRSARKGVLVIHCTTHAHTHMLQPPLYSTHTHTHTHTQTHTQTHVNSMSLPPGTLSIHADITWQLHKTLWVLLPQTTETRHPASKEGWGGSVHGFLILYLTNQVCIDAASNGLTVAVATVTSMHALVHACIGLTKPFFRIHNYVITKMAAARTCRGFFLVGGRSLDALTNRINPRSV